MSNTEDLKNIMGLGGSSIRKNYYSQLQKKIDELEKEKNHFKRIFSEALNGIFQSDPDGIIIAANPAMVYLAGYGSFDQFRQIGSIRENLFCNRDEYDELMGKLAENGSIHEFDTNLETASGDIIEVTISATLVAEEKVSMTEFFVQNISERKKSLKLTRSIINSIPSIIIGVDGNLKITMWNSEAEKEYGLVRDAVIGRELVRLLPDLSNLQDSIRKVIETMEPVNNIRKTRNKDDLSMLWEISISPLTGMDNKGAVLRIDDVTEQVRLQKMMIQSEKMLSIGGLAAGMAHEINNPLAGMMQSSDVLKRRLSDKGISGNIKAAEKAGISLEALSEYIRERGIDRMLQGISDSGKRAAEIIENILSFSRKEDMGYTSVKPDEIVKGVLLIAESDYNLKKKFDFKNIEIIKDFQKGLPPLPCVLTQIQQVLFNILRNGTEAMREIVDPLYKPRFNIRLSLKDECILFEIEDNGPGMNDEVRQRLFEPFFTTKPIGIGTGLGLSVSYFIITENHGGTIEVQSKEGEGSTFFIKLPLERNR